MAVNVSHDKVGKAFDLSVLIEQDTMTRQARITRGGKRIHLGYHNCIDDAVAARSVTEKAMGFHVNHGREVAS